MTNNDKAAAADSKNVVDEIDMVRSDVIEVEAEVLEPVTEEQVLLEAFDQTKASIAAMVQTFGLLRIIDKDDSAGFEAVSTARKEAKRVRCAIDNKRKDLNSDGQDRIRRINEYARELVAPLRSVELALQAKETAVKAERDKDRLKLLEARQAKLRERMNALGAVGGVYISQLVEQWTEEEFQTMLADETERFEAEQELKKAEDKRLEEERLEREGRAEAKRQADVVAAAVRREQEEEEMKGRKRKLAVKNVRMMDRLNDLSKIDAKVLPADIFDLDDEAYELMYELHQELFEKEQKRLKDEADEREQEEEARNAERARLNQEKADLAAEKQKAAEEEDERKRVAAEAAEVERLKAVSALAAKERQEALVAAEAARPEAERLELFAQGLLDLAVPEGRAQEAVGEIMMSAFDSISRIAQALVHVPDAEEGSGD